MNGRLTTFALAAGVLAGCTNPDAAYREDAAQAFRTNLVAETERVLAEAGGMLTISNALEITHTRSLKLAQQDLETKLARINRATVFSAFLPTVALSANGLLADGGVYDVPNLGDFESNRLRAKSASLVVAQPVLTPVAWVMFAESQYGVRIKDIVRERAEQLLDVQVAALFYQTAVAERRVETAARQLESARALTNRVTRLADEGYATSADAARAKARCVLAETSLDAARDDVAAAREELAGLLRLWPLAKFKVSGESLLALPPLPEKRVEEWVWDGLLARKDLAAGDQTLELRKAQVIEALAGFLPNIVLGGGGLSGSIEDVAIRGWAGSLMGTWAIFEGFRTVQQYRAARATRETEFKLQEERMTAVVIAVADSWRQRRLVRQKATAARAWAEAARLDYEAAARRYEDGNETLSSVLDKLATSEDAETKLAESAYGEAMSDILLRQAVGIDVIEKEKK